MIKNKIFLVLIIFIAVSAYWGIFNVYSYKTDELNDSLEKIPIVVVSQNDTLINKIKISVDSLNFVSKSNLTMSDSLKNSLIEKYKLDNASDYLNSSGLPNILKIYIKKGMFTANAKMQIGNMLLRSKNDVVIKYNDPFWAKVNDEVSFLQNAMKMITIFFWGIFAIILLYLKCTFEQLNAFYWKVFLRGGGNFSKRIIQEILYSILISLIAVILVWTEFYFLKSYSNYIVVNSLTYYFMMFGGILLINLISLIFIKKKI